MHRMYLLVIAGLLLCMSHAAHAHGGGLNRDGCHTNRSTGEYHCHRDNSASGSRSNLQNAARTGRPATGVAFQNCSHARAAGAAPVRRGEPGYGPHLDRDNDGVGCE